MNVIDLPITGIALGQTTPQPTTGNIQEDTSGGFGSILSGVMEEIVSESLMEGLNQNVLLNQALPMMTAHDVSQLQGIEIAMVRDNESLFKLLGDNLLNLANQFLNQGQASITGEKLLPVIDDIINDLQLQNADAQSSLIDVMSGVEQKVLENPESIVAEMMNGLSGTTKLKIQSHNQESDQTPIDGEIISLQNVLVANLLSMTNQGVSRETQPGSIELDRLSTGSTANGKGIRLSENLMISPSNSNQEGHSTNTSTVSALSSSEIQVSDPDSLLEVPADGSIIKPSDSREEVVLKNKDNVLTGTKGQENQKDESFSPQNKANTEDGPKAAAANSDSSQTSYGLAGPKLSFAHEISKTIAMHSGSHGEYSRAADTSQFIGQVVKQFDVLLAGGRSEATIKLKPEQLGELKIHLIVENGTMKAVLDASSPHVKDMIEANLSNLKSSLESQGLHIKEFSVSVGNNHKDHGSSRNQGHHRSFTQIHGEPMAEEEIRSIRASVILNGDRVVNYLA